MTGFGNMSEDMVLRVLPKLPPKSLIRFKCIGKSWYNLINCPLFVEMHLSNSKHNMLYTSFIFNDSIQSNPNTGETELAFSFLYLCKDNDNNEQTKTVAKLPISTEQGLEVIKSPSIIDHCDGILLLSDDNNAVVLCNPAIKEIKVLPKSCLPNWMYCCLGFGYDPNSKDYKVQRIASYHGEPVGDKDMVISPPRVEIYSLSTACWREIKNDSLETEVTFFSPEIFQMYFKGICYWVGYEQPKEYEYYTVLDDDINKKPMIFLFDTCDEVFHNILLPNSSPGFEGLEYCYDDMCWCVSIIMWNNESIALFGLDQFGALPDQSRGIWVMDDNGGGWTRYVTFEPSVGIRSVLKFWKAEEILMVTTNGDIVSYNLDSHQLKNLSTHSEDSAHYQPIMYVNSLIPVL